MIARNIFTVTLFLMAPFIVTAQESLSTSDEKRLKAVAKDFVTDLMRNHDLRPLLSKWFVPSFEMAAEVDLETEPADLMRRLTPTERRRIFVAFWNSAYAQLVISQSKPKALECYDESPACEAKRREAMLRVLSAKTVSLMEEREREGETKPLTRSQLLADTELMESMFDEALPILQQKDLEQTIEFQHWVKLFEADKHLGYLIKERRADKDFLDSSRRKVIAKGEYVYGVETPLILRFDFVRRGSAFKIYNIDAGDGD